MKKLVSLVTCVGFVVVLGCSEENTDKTASQSSNSQASNPASTVGGSKYLLDSEPDGAEDVIKVRQASKDGDDVLIVGRIGGSENPWIASRAAFSIVDGSLKACSDIPGDQCEKPWDYCCETDKLPTSMAFVKLVDEQGNLVTTDARELLQVKELSTVVIKGKAQRDEEGNLTVLASGVYVKKK